MVSLPEEGSQAEPDGLGIGQARDGRLGMLLSGPETQIELRGCGTSSLEMSPVQTQEDMVRKKKGTGIEGRQTMLMERAVWLREAEKVVEDCTRQKLV